MGRYTVLIINVIDELFEGDLCQYIILTIDIIDELFNDWLIMILKIIVIIYCINWYWFKDDIKLYIVLNIGTELQGGIKYMVVTI